MKARSISPSLRWWVVAWFVLALGVSMASPLVRPGMLELVCAGAQTGTGLGASVQLVEHSDGVASGAAALDPYCLLCLTGAAAPPVGLSLPVAFALPAQGRVGSSGAVPVPALAWRPPARAPPFVFSPSHS